MLCVGNGALARIQVSVALTVPRLGATAAASTTAACKGRQAKQRQAGQARTQYERAPRDSYMRLRVGGGRRCFV
jgi:hypothetical protein